MQLSLVLAGAAVEILPPRAVGLAFAALGLVSCVIEHATRHRGVSETTYPLAP